MKISGFLDTVWSRIWLNFHSNKYQHEKSRRRRSWWKGKNWRNQVPTNANLIQKDNWIKHFSGNPRTKSCPGIIISELYSILALLWAVTGSRFSRSLLNLLGHNFIIIFSRSNSRKETCMANLSKINCTLLRLPKMLFKNHLVIHIMSY